MAEPTKESGGTGSWRVPLTGLIPAVAAIAAALVGTLVLAGWWLDVSMLRSGLGIGVAMNPTTAVGFVLAAASLWSTDPNSTDNGFHRVGRACADGVVLIGALKLGEWLFHWPLSIDQILFKTRLASLDQSLPNRMAPNTAACFLMLGLALLLIRARSNGWRHLGRSLGVAVGFLGFATLVGYGIGQPLLTRLPEAIPMALNTAVGFLVLSAGATAASLRSEPPRQTKSVGAELHRTVNFALVVALVIVVSTGGISVWSALRAQKAAGARLASSVRLGELARLLSLLQDAETGERGFLLTGQPEFLEPYRTALDSLPMHLRRAEVLLAHDQQQSRRLDTLETLAEQQLAVLTEVIELRRSQHSEAALQIVQSGRGMRIMNEVRRVVALMSADENSRVTRWNARLQADERTTLVITGASDLVAVAFLLLAGLAINWGFSKLAEAEAALRESERHLAQTLMHLPNMVYLKEPKELRFAQLNRAGEELLGFKPEELLGKTAFDLVPAVDAQRFEAEDRRVLAGEMVGIGEERIQTRARGLRILQSKKVAIRDDQGRPLFLLGVAEDITDRKQAEEERDLFFTLSLDMLCIANADGYFKRLSPAFTRTLGWSAEEMLARPFIEFVHPDDRGATLREMERLVEAGEPVLNFENRYQHKDGSWLVLSWKAVPQPGGLIYATARDVTESREIATALREAADAAEVANLAKSDFLAKMSHELRTPLNAIIGFSEILEDPRSGALTDKQRRYLGNILLSGRNLLQLINDILDLSRVEAGRMELVPAEFDLGAALDEVRTLVSSIAIKKNIQIQLAVEQSMPRILADEAKLRQIMLNLVSNAIKFSPEGGQVGISARLTGERGTGAGRDWLEVAVTDAGIGIRPEDQARIFRDFEQVGHERLTAQQGTGLGLAVTRGLVELHGGKVWVESQFGSGSTFRFTLPVRCLPPIVEPATATDPLETEGPLVLVVEDEWSARQLLVHYLTDAGYRTATAGTGKEAIALALALKPDAITLDIRLPDSDGLLILAQLKMRPDTHDIPVVVVSVTDRNEVGLTLGVAEWLVKPVDRNDLLAALEKSMRDMLPAAPRRVLVVDDEQTAVEYLRDLLTEQGYQVLAANGGRTGIALALSKRPDAIILDLVMPGVNGFDVVHALRADPEAQAIPILVLSAKELTGAERQHLRSSVQAIVAKGGKARLLAELSRICPVAQTSRS